MRHLITFVFTFISTTVFSQFELKGKIIAADTKSPLAAASVFLSNTSTGTVTNAAGEFTLQIPAGTYDMVASFVGYETYAQPISKASASMLVIELKPKVEVFDEVVVGGYEKDGWEKWGKFFLENFIGTSQWAADCSIKNYEAIKFRNNKKENKLSAIAMDQLVIENKALGYTVRYQLEEFEYDFKSGYIYYQGYPFFSQMKGGQARHNRWNKRRQEVYHGSMMDFMRALYRNRIVEEGYEVRRLVKTPNEEKARVRELYRNRASISKPGTVTVTEAFPDSADYYRNVLHQPDELSSFSSYTIPGDSIAFQVDNVTAGLEFENYLHIIYKKASPPESYRRLSPNNARMMSELILVHPGAIQIQSNGSYYPPLNLLSIGYWAWSEKMADMLPFDYKPPATDH